MLSLQTSPWEIPIGDYYSNATQRNEFSGIPNKHTSAATILRRYHPIGALQQLFLPSPLEVLGGHGR